VSTVYRSTTASSEPGSAALASPAAMANYTTHNI
jgi:hypothetical protein